VIDEIEESLDAPTAGPPTARSPWLWASAVLSVLLLGIVTAWASGFLAVHRDEGTGRGKDLAEESAEPPRDFPSTVSFAPPATANETKPESRPVTNDPAAPPELSALASPPTSSGPDRSTVAKPVNDGSEASASGFQRLFNGVDLAGWIPRGCRARDWLVQDSCLSFRASGDRPLTPNLRLTPAERKKQLFRIRNDRAAVLFTERSYHDFDLQLEFRTSGTATSGIVLADLDRGDRLPRFGEFAISLSDSPGWKTGDFHSWNFGNLVRQASARSVDLKKGDAWNSLELASRNGSLSLKVNGQKVEYDGAIKLEGPRRIGLRGMPGDVRFRNIETQGRPATPEGANGQAGLLLGRVVYADDLSDPATGWSREDIDNGPGQEPFKRNYEGGVYFLEAPPNWTGTSAWNVWDPLSRDIQFEVIGRVLGDDNQSPGAWGLIIAGPAQRGLQVTIDRLGRFSLEPALWGAEKYPNDPRLGPFSHPAIRPGKEWNEVTFRVRRRRLEVLVNSIRVCEPLKLGWDLTPATPQIAVWKPERLSRIRAEFDWMELRELRAESP
jgi:hypothetical protein